MTNFARIINNVAVDVSGNPTEAFHQSIAEQFEPVPDEVKIGWCLADGKWRAPEPTPAPEPAPATTEAPKVSPVEFKLLFTSQERVAIKAARATDPVIDDFFEIVEDQRLTYVDLGLQSTKDAIGHLQSKGLLTAERADAILSGKIV